MKKYGYSFPVSGEGESARNDHQTRNTADKMRRPSAVSVACVLALSPALASVAAVAVLIIA